MIKVFTVPHTKFAAMHLVDQLNALGYPAKIVEQVNPDAQSMYIIYNAAALSRLPRNYIVMQTEIATSHWFNKRYKLTLKNARAVWDYSYDNIDAYRSITKKVCVVRPGICPQVRKEKDIDFLFYGWVEGSPRRADLLAELKKELPSLRVINNTLGAEMWDLLNRTRVVINLHYFDNSPLELYRIHEALSHNCHVVSEGHAAEYKHVVDFETEPVHMAAAAVIKSAKEFKYDLTPFDNMREIVDGLIIAGL